jgi:hypothetical protein
MGEVIVVSNGSAGIPDSESKERECWQQKWER